MPWLVFYSIGNDELQQIEVSPGYAKLQDKTNIYPEPLPNVKKLLGYAKLKTEELPDDKK